MRDLISRKQAIDAINSAFDRETLLAGFVRSIAVRAIRDMPPAQPEYKMDEWCTDCKEYDHDKHCCPRFNRVIAETIKEAKENTQPEPKVEFHDKDHVWIGGKQYISLRRFQEAVKEAQPKEGHWIQYGKRFPWRFHYKCSECGNYLDFSGVNGGRGKANYCPNCGVKMKGEPND